MNGRGIEQTGGIGLPSGTDIYPYGQVWSSVVQGETDRRPASLTVVPSDTAWTNPGNRKASLLHPGHVNAGITLVVM